MKRPPYAPRWAAVRARGELVKRRGDLVQPWKKPARPHPAMSSCAFGPLHLGRQLRDPHLVIEVGRGHLNPIWMDTHPARRSRQRESMEWLLFPFVPEDERAFSSTHGGHEEALRVIVHRPDPLIRET